MADRKRTLLVLVKIRAPAGLSAAQVRREVRTLINEQANWFSDPGDIRAVKVSAAPTPAPGSAP